MKIGLFDFQENALAQLREKLWQARQFASVANAQAISFSAPTASGKTIVLTALFEDIFFGDPTLPAQGDAVILWVSDVPQLNEQSRLKIEGLSDRIRTGQLVTIDSSTFADAPRLDGGFIYFVNSQKLGEDKLLTTHGDRREFTIWETIANTARTIPDRFYVVIDEAHRGMREGKASERATSIMQRFLKGSAEHCFDRMPLVIGVSATLERFEQQLTGTTYTLHRVYVPVEAVRESGLLKDRIVIRFPEDNTEAEMSLVREAAVTWRDSSLKWHAYCVRENERIVAPILVIQIEDATRNALTRTRLDEVLATIESAIGRRLRDGEVAQTFADGDYPVAGRVLRSVEASRIEEDAKIGVVLFKMGLSTGWDCPRAEVMMSFRAAHDHTYIAQLLGRMVRTPLARRIQSDASLNDVHLLLPHFDRDAVEKVVEDLKSVEEVPPTEIGTSRELVTLARRDGCETIFEAMAPLVTYRVNAVRKQSALRRLMGLARAVSHDRIDEEALEVIRGVVVRKMAEQVQQISRGPNYERQVEGIKRVGVTTITVAISGGPSETSDAQRVDTALADVDQQFEDAGRSFGNGLHMAYWQALADRNALDVKVDVILLSCDVDRMRTLESEAEAAFDALYEKHRQKIRKLLEARRIHYERLRLATATPKDISWQLPDVINFKRSKTAAVYERHLYLEPDKQFRCDLGPWEREVLEEELQRHDVVAWLRNVDRKDWSLEIPYQDGAEERPLFPDLVIVRQDGSTFLFDVLEPHDPSLRDNFAKARGLARFAERHGHLYSRLQLIRKVRSGGRDVFRRLDVGRLNVRRMVQDVADNNQLDDVFDRAAD